MLSLQPEGHWWPLETTHGRRKCLGHMENYIDSHPKKISWACRNNTWPIEREREFCSSQKWLEVASSGWLQWFQTSCQLFKAQRTQASWTTAPIYTNFQPGMTQTLPYKHHWCDPANVAVKSIDHPQFPKTCFYYFLFMGFYKPQRRCQILDFTWLSYMVAS